MYSAAQFGSWLSLVVKRLDLLGCILPVTPVLFCVSNSVQCVCLPPPCFFFKFTLFIDLFTCLLTQWHMPWIKFGSPRTTGRFYHVDPGALKIKLRSSSLATSMDLFQAESHCDAQDDFELLIFLPPPFQHWACIDVPPWPPHFKCGEVMTYISCYPVCSAKHASIYSAIPCYHLLVFESSQGPSVLISFCGACYLSLSFYSS